MDIIFYRYNSVCEPDYIAAFQRLGISVIEDVDGMDNAKDLSAKLTNLGNLIAGHSPLFVFSINFFPFVSHLCERLGIKYVAESVDCPVFEIFNRSIANSYNRMFLFDKKQYDSIKKANPVGIKYLPLGAPVERVSKLLENVRNYKYDVSFVGSLYKEKDPILDLNISENLKKKIDELVEKQIDESVYGLEYVEDTLRNEDVNCIKAADKTFFSSDDSVWNIDRYVAINDYISSHIAYRERVKILSQLAECENTMHLFTRSDSSELSDKVIVHGGVKTLDEMPYVFRQSKINLNITMRSIQTGIPQRVWDVLACRGFLITNAQPEIEDYFVPGKHLETYSCLGELLEKVGYYLKNDEARERIAEEGYREVSEKHTVTMRTIEMIRVMSNE